MVTEKEYFEISILQRMAFVKQVTDENKVLHRIRENHQGNPMIVSLARQAIFNNGKLLKYLQEGIEHDKENLKRIG